MCGPSCPTASCAWQHRWWRTCTLPRRGAGFVQGNAANRDMWIFTSDGAAAVIAGNVLYYLGRGADASQDAGRIRITLAQSRLVVQSVVSARTPL